MLRGQVADNLDTGVNQKQRTVKMKTIIKNGEVLNVHTSQYEKKNIVVEDDKITALTTSPVTAGKGDVVIDAKGKYILPGLIDAHVHVTSATVDLATPQLPITYITCCAVKNLTEALQRGFTTMRDVGGADFGLAMAVNNGIIPGSRLFYCGRALSQTGGHGDFRAMTYDG
ncbi:MAG: amidohydrolase family protein, partial [Methanoregula sp.]|nr:amidohydrolase family protein [Methanoregula sp.]